MTAMLEEAVDVAQPNPVRYASWGARCGALALDVLPGAATFAVLALLWISAPERSWLWWLYIATAFLVVLAMAVNRVLLPALVGWTLGRAVFAIRVEAADGRAVTGLRLLLRELAHVLDTAAVFIGWLWPLWDGRNRTFADLLLRTEVRTVEGPKRNARRIAAWVLAAAAVLSTAAAGLGYATAYRHERAVDQARAELTDQGPRIVEQMLSYGKDSMVDDFAKAQALVTDGYRPQLIAQQGAVQKAGVVDNEYWAVSSAVLPDPPVQPGRAAMLLALQGQRGANQNDLKFITATVRADFEKIDGQWRISNLTVLKKPQTNAGPGQ